MNITTTKKHNTRMIRKDRKRLESTNFTFAPPRSASLYIEPNDFKSSNKFTPLE